MLPLHVSVAYSQHPGVYLSHHAKTKKKKCTFMEENIKAPSPRHDKIKNQKAGKGEKAKEKPMVSPSDAAMEVGRRKTKDSTPTKTKDPQKKPPTPYT